MPNIPVVKFFVFLELEQKLIFFKGLRFLETSESALLSDI